MLKEYFTYVNTSKCFAMDNVCPALYDVPSIDTKKPRKPIFIKLDQSLNWSD